MPASPAANLESHLGYWLRFVSNHVSHAFARKVEGRGVTVAEWVVLRSLFDAGRVNPSSVASALGMTRGAISKLIDRLLVKKLVACSVDVEDRRFQTVSLTPSGRKLVPILAKLADENDAEFFDSLTGDQRSQLLTLLKRIVELRRLTAVPVK